MGKQTIQEIARILVEKNKLTLKEANQFVSTMFEVIQQQLDNEGLVKIKGFGTFKMIRVEARESVSVRTGERVTIDSHAKITFTPDAAMKELVNKPFSQFETVVLNDGVEFEDLSEDEIEEDIVSEEHVAPVAVVEPPVVKEDTPVVKEEEVPIVEEETPPVIEEQPIVPPLKEVVDDAPEQPEQSLFTEKEDSPVITRHEEATIFVDDKAPNSSWKKTMGYGLLTLVLMAASAFGGYWYGQRTAESEVEVIDEEEEYPEIEVADSIDVIEDDTLDLTEKFVEQPVASETKEEQTTEEEPFWKKYEAMDIRVRTGAYHIIGTDHEVKVRKGETLSRIARRELGEGMSCYIEVYNDLNANSELQEGQIIKIPKLKWKVKR